jgi:SNF family Na+-dependent transporter
MSFAKSPSLKRFAWGSCGGTITGPQNFLKDALTVIKATENYEYPWFFPLLVIFAALTSFVGLLQLTACMKRYDATYSAAAFVGSFVVSASLNAAAHYNTFDALESPVNYVLYPFGILVLMIGVFILERSHSSSQETPIINGGKESEDSKVRVVLLYCNAKNTDDMM